MSTQINVKDALLDAEAALELAIQRILKRDPGHAVHVTSEAKALVSVRQALSQCQGCAVQQGYVPVETLSAEIQEPQKFTGDSEMRRAFEIEYGQSWVDPDWRKETGIWASAWHKATASAQLAAAQQGVQPPFMYAIADGYGQPFFEEEGCVSSEAKDLQPEVDSLNENLDGEPPYEVVALYTHPTPQGLAAQTKAARSVLAERTRQIAAEGYTPEQDDSYNPGVLALHGGLYACHAFDSVTKKRAPEGWQWDEKWWKPKDPRSNLVKAGALILAEIERMDRSFAAQAKQGGV